jgi:hypothetical protein
MQDRLPVEKIVPGDLVRQAGRTVAVGAVGEAAIVYHGLEHPVVRVEGFDPAARRYVVFVAVPDQRVTVVR